MAITWELKVTNVTGNRGDVTATRTDSESTLPARSYSMPNTPIGTPEAEQLILKTFQEWDDAAMKREKELSVVADRLKSSAEVSFEAFEAKKVK